MKKLLPLILIALVLLNCTHEQFQSYLLDNGLEEREPVDRDVEAVDESGIPPSYSDELASIKKVYSTPFPTTDKPNKKYIKVLIRAKKDLESFYLIAEYLSKYKKNNDLKIFEGFAREYMNEGIDSLIEHELTNDDLEVKKIVFELQYIKALLYYEFKDIVRACNTLNKLDSQLTHNMNVNVDFMAGRLNKEKKHMVLTEFNYICNKNIINKITNK